MIKYISSVLLLTFLCACGSAQNEDEKGTMKSEKINSGSIIGNQLSPFNVYSPNEYVEDYFFTEKDRIRIDIDNDSQDDLITFLVLDSLYLKRGKYQKSADPGDFQVITFSLTRENTKDTLVLMDGWIKKLFLYDMKLDKSRAKTDYVEIYQSGKNNLIILEGYIYGSGESTQTIINVYDGEPTPIFNDDQRIQSIKTNEGGEIEIVASKKSAKDQYQGGDVTYKVNKWLFPEK